MKIKVILEYQQIKKKRIEFKDDPEIYFLHECDSESKRLRNKVERGEIKDSILYFGMYYLQAEGNYTDGIMSQLIRAYDAYKSKEQYTNDQLRANADFIDMEVRNNFYEGVTLSTLKRIALFNHHGQK